MAEKPEIMAIVAAADKGKWMQQSTEPTIEYDIEWMRLREEEGYINHNITINQKDEIVLFVFACVSVNDSYINRILIKVNTTIARYSVLK